MYTLIIKKNEKVVCTFTVDNFNEACEIEKSATSLEFTVIWRFENDTE